MNKNGTKPQLLQKLLYLNVTDITQQSGTFFDDNVKFNTGSTCFEIIYLLTVFNIEPILHFWVRNNAIN